MRELIDDFRSGLQGQHEAGEGRSGKGHCSTER